MYAIIILVSASKKEQVVVKEKAKGKNSFYGQVNPDSVK